MEIKFFKEFKELKSYFSMGAVVYERGGYKVRYIEMDLTGEEYSDISYGIRVPCATYRDDSHYLLKTSEEEFVLEQFNKLARIYNPSNTEDKITQLRYHIYNLENLLKDVTPDSPDSIYFQDFIKRFTNYG